jgi:hypothetical protein
MKKSRNLLPLVLLAAALMAVALTIPAAAQVPVLELEQELDFDDPEAWAMKYFASASLLTGLGAVERRSPGAVELGFELLQIPDLDPEQRTVGFGGFKEEDLNRTPVWGRLRVMVGLPQGFGLVLGWVPPVEIDGVKANLLSLAVEKVLFERERWALGLRIYGQTGETTGDLTCSAGGDERFPPGSAENPFGCEGPSSDEVTLDHLGIELVASHRPRGKRAPVLHFGASVNSLDLEFQVDAQTFGFRDRTRLLADGDTVAFTAGATWDLAPKTRLGLELFYTGLDVERRGQEKESDSLFNLRALVRYRLR